MGIEEGSGRYEVLENKPEMEPAGGYRTMEIIAHPDEATDDKILELWNEYSEREDEIVLWNYAFTIYLAFNHGIDLSDENVFEIPVNSLG